MVKSTAMDQNIKSSGPMVFKQFFNLFVSIEHLARLLTLIIEMNFKLLNFYQAYRYQKLRKIFSGFYHRHSDFISKYNVGLKKNFLQKGLSESELYGD